MKKIFVILSVLTLMFSLSACGNSSSMKDDISNGISSLESAADSTMDKISGDNNDKTSQNTATISKEEAKNKALSHAGLKETDIMGLDIDLEHDDGIYQYDISFYSGDKEYDYEINAQTGEIISADSERN
ncbi:MAG: hypothetical protein E7562_04810 [Ruminococcaceae bacterium]|nr:hypothetical protein [Oscillospiraceae bacterium]